MQVTRKRGAFPGETIECCGCCGGSTCDQCGGCTECFPDVPRRDYMKSSTLRALDENIAEQRGMMLGKNGLLLIGYKNMRSGSGKITGGRKNATNI